MEGNLEKYLETAFMPSFIVIFFYRCTQTVWQSFTFQSVSAYKADGNMRAAYLIQVMYEAGLDR